MLSTIAALILAFSSATYGLALPQPYDADLAAILSEMPEGDFGMATFNSSAALQARNDPIPKVCTVLSDKVDAFQDFTYIWMTYPAGSAIPDHCLRMRVLPQCGTGTRYWTTEEFTDMIIAVRLQASKDGQFTNTKYGRWSASYQLGTTAVADQQKLALGFLWLQMRLSWFSKVKPLEYTYRYGQYIMEIKGDNCLNEKGKRDVPEQTGAERLLELYKSLQA